MDKETYILQTTRAGRLPTNAVFVEERLARLETERARNSGQFAYIKLVHLVGKQRTTLFEFGKPPNGTPAGGKGEPARAKTKQVTPAQLINRISFFVTLGLIGGVVYYAIQYFNTK
jgi:hypothetical protein